MENSLSMSAELLQQISYIADNESAMKKAMKYIKKLVAQVREAATAEDDDYRPRTRAELLADFDQSCKELKLNLEGKLELMSAEELLNEL